MDWSQDPRRQVSLFDKCILSLVLTFPTTNSFYARAVEGCGMEYRSGKIWDSYLKWEQANGTPRDVLAVYDQLLLIPTQDHQQYFDK